MQHMEAGKINSILNRKNTVENNIINKEEEKDIEERAEQIMDKVDEQYESYQETERIIQEARKLLGKYGSSKDIPREEFAFESTGFDDARLLAFCKLIEKKNKQGN
jgi:hypothetical protein